MSNNKELEPAQQAPQLPEIISLASCLENPPKLADELISGILRCGHKMLISGSSKAGKSHFLMELAIAIAEGMPWLSFQCKQGKVLYLNLEIDGESCKNRFLTLYGAMNLEPIHIDNINLWNLRGYAYPLEKLTEGIVQRCKSKDYVAMILDPIYKLLSGDENSAADMAKFTNEIDRICNGTGCAVIYSHHHSKGSQGGKRAMDRASGSGVFARDVDALMDLVELTIPKEMKTESQYAETTAWRLEGSLREFRSFPPMDIWFTYPLHYVDSEGILKGTFPEGSPMANLSKSSKRTSPKQRKAMLEKAYEVCSVNQPVTVKRLALEMGISEKAVRKYIKENEQTYWIQQGLIGRK